MDTKADTKADTEANTKADTKADTKINESPWYEIEIEAVDNVTESEGEDYTYYNIPQAYLKRFTYFLLLPILAVKQPKEVLGTVKGGYVQVAIPVDNIAVFTVFLTVINLYGQQVPAPVHETKSARNPLQAYKHELSKFEALVLYDLITEYPHAPGKDWFGLTHKTFLKMTQEEPNTLRVDQQEDFLALVRAYIKLRSPETQLLRGDIVYSKQDCREIYDNDMYIYDAPIEDMANGQLIEMVYDFAREGNLPSQFKVITIKTPTENYDTPITYWDKTPGSWVTWVERFSATGGLRINLISLLLFLKLSLLFKLIHHI